MKFTVETKKTGDQVPLTWTHLRVGEQVVVLRSPNRAFDGTVATVFPFGDKCEVGLMFSGGTEYRRVSAPEYAVRRLVPDDEIERENVGPAVKFCLKPQPQAKGTRASELKPGQPAIIVGFVDNCPSSVKGWVKVGDGLIGGQGSVVAPGEHPTFKDGYLTNTNSSYVLVRPLAKGERLVFEGE